jgi:hypothetical protein
MLLVHAEAQALLRKELIDTLGMDRARGLLTRMGYASGLRDAELARTRSQDCSDVEAFMTGPQLHTLEGIVHVTPVQLQLDRMAGRFYGEFLWENSTTVSTTSRSAGRRSATPAATPRPSWAGQSCTRKSNASAWAM